MKTTQKKSLLLVLAFVALSSCSFLDSQNEFRMEVFEESLSPMIYSKKDTVNAAVGMYWLYTSSNRNQFSETQYDSELSVYEIDSDNKKIFEDNERRYKEVYGLDWFVVGLKNPRFDSIIKKQIKELRE